MSWVRVMVANYLAAGGKQWSDTFSRQNGGTYNNQWSAARPLLQARPLLKGRALCKPDCCKLKGTWVASLPGRSVPQLN